MSRMGEEDDELIIKIIDSSVDEIVLPEQHQHDRHSLQSEPMQRMVSASVVRAVAEHSEVRSSKQAIPLARTAEE